MSNPKTSIVLGGGGFLGSHLVEGLLDRGDEVAVFDRPDAAYLQFLALKGAKIYTGDFLNIHELQKALKGMEVAYHMISTTVPKSSSDNPIFDIQSNLVGTINILNAAKDVGVNKIIISSSGGTVYGIPKSIPITEDHPTNPISSYGITKLAIEKYTHLYWSLHGLEYRILRISNAYGERQVVNGLQGVIPTMIDEILNHKEIRVWGDGSVIRDFIYVSDIIDAFIKVSNYEGVPRIFNISTGIGHSIIDIIRMLESYFAKPLKLCFETRMAYDVPLNILDSTLAGQKLNWKPKVNLTDGLRKTVYSMQKQVISKIP